MISTLLHILNRSRPAISVSLPSPKGGEGQGEEVVRVQGVWLPRFSGQKGRPSIQSARHRNRLGIAG
jgi:hypothetical protein